MKLTSPNVEALFLSCLFKKEEDTSNAKLVEGVKMKVGFNPLKLEESKKDIEDLLSQCHPNFMANTEAGGWSFLNFCQDKDDDLWTGVHAIMDQLICLGLAIGKVEFLMPKEYWEALPGGMPYIKILQ